MGNSAKIIIFTAFFPESFPKEPFTNYVNFLPFLDSTPPLPNQTDDYIVQSYKNVMECV